MASETVLVLGGGNRQTVSIVRSLGLAGYRCLVGVEAPREIVRFSRHTHETWLHPQVAGEPAAFFPALQDLLARRPDVRWVFPVGEDEIRLLLARWAELPDPRRVVMAEPEVVALCFDKPRFYELAGQCGIPFAPFGVANGPAELDEWVRRIGYPLVVKPWASVGEIDGRRGCILMSAADRERKLPTWPANHAALIVQRFAGGFRHNCQFVAHEGRIIAYFEHRVLRTNRRDGTRSAVESVSVPPSPRLRDYTARLVAQLRYSGPGDSQFLVDDREHPMLLELNPRLDANVEAARRSGVDITLSAMEEKRYRLAESATPPVLSDTYVHGLRCQWLMGDVLGIVHDLAVGDITREEARAWARQMLKAAMHADFHLVGWMRDPLPALAAAAQNARALVSLARRLVFRAGPIR